MILAPATPAEPDGIFTVGHTGRTWMVMDPAVELRIALKPRPHFVEISDEIEAVLGYTAAAFLHDPTLLVGRAHPDDVPVVRALLLRPNRFERPVSYRARHRAGHWVWLEQLHRAGATDDEIRSTIRVLDPLHAADAAEHFKTLVDSSVEALAILDGDGTVRYESPAVEHVLGYLPGEQVGHNAFDFIHPDDVPEVAAAFAAIADKPGAQARRRYRHRHKDGRWRLVESVAQNVLDNPLIRGILVHTHAVEERRRVEQHVTDTETALRMLAESRAELIAELHRTQRQKDELSALVVHDLKNPLTGILANVELLLDTCATPDDREALLDIQRGAESLIAMVVDLLDISRSEDGALEPQHAEVDVPKFLAALAEALKALSLAANKELVLDIELADPRAWFDESLIRRVLANLLDNAFRFAPAGSQLRLVARGDAESLELRVCDHGPGVPDRDKARVFAKYVQLESRRVRHNRGLGLVFSKVAVAAHGGDIWVEDNEPVGSQFCVRLPR